MLQLEWQILFVPCGFFAVAAHTSSLRCEGGRLRLRSRLAQDFVPRSSIDPRQRANIGKVNENLGNSTTDAAFKPDYRLVR